MLSLDGCGNLRVCIYLCIQRLLDAVRKCSSLLETSSLFYTLILEFREVLLFTILSFLLLSFLLLKLGLSLSLFLYVCVCVRWVGGCVGGREGGGLSSIA